MSKNKSVILRLSETDNKLLEFKSSIFGLDKSKLIRLASLSYWDNKNRFKEILGLYQNSSPDDKDLIINVLFEYYRRYGYPYRKISNKDKNKMMAALSQTKSPLLENDHLQCNSCSVALPNSFHPHMAKVKCLSKLKTSYDQYDDDVSLKDSIKRWLDLGKTPNPAGLRRILRTRDGVRSVVNFKPAISKYIYDTYCPTNGKVLDPCAGYGGRLCGLIASNKNISYHGIDPDSRTIIGNTKLAGYFYEQYNRITKEREWNFHFKTDLGCAEDVMPNLHGDYDLIFTSPPYFDVEKYSEHPNQSYLRYKTYDTWIKSFIGTIISESSRLLKSDGYLVLNVKNYKKFPIADDCVRFAGQYGFVLHKTYNMRLANSEYHLKDGHPTFHTEPIFVFKKYSS